MSHVDDPLPSTLRQEELLDKRATVRVGSGPMVALRREFPALDECVYLNSCSAGAVPRGVEEVFRAYWDALKKFRDEVWEQWWVDLYAYADGVARFLGAPPGSVVTDGSLSALLGRVASCFSYGGGRNRVIVTDREHPTIPFVFRSFARYGARLEVVTPRPGQSVEDALIAAIDHRTLLVCMSHASFTTGEVFDVARVAARAHAREALIAVDAYQSVGVLPVDVRKLDVDFLLAGAHKWLCGSPECAFLYVRPELAKHLRPAATGWMAGQEPFGIREPSGHAVGARRFACGTPAVLPALVSRVGQKIIAGLGIDAIRAISLRRTERIMALADEAGLEVLTPRAPARRGGVVALDFPDAAEVAAELNRTGYVCSHRGALRVAPHFYNTDTEVDRFMTRLVALARGRR